VLEGPATWNFLEPEFEARRPVPLVFDANAAGGAYARFNAVWLIEGQVFPKMAGRGWHIFGTPPMSVAAHAKPFAVGSQDMTDIPTRLADMDRLGIHYQVVYPTLFLVSLTQDGGLERALCRSYNRFMAEACSTSNGRIRFAAVVPFHDMQHAGEVAREAKELGAVSAMVLGLMGDNPLSDEQFYPLYEALSDLRLPLAIHVGWGSPAMTSVFTDQVNSVFSGLVVPVLMGFWSMMAGGVYERFPELKVAFLEAGCEWLPYLVNQLDRYYERGLPRLKRAPSEILKDGNVYLACESEENIAQIIPFIGEDQLVLASDYGHVDASWEEDMVRGLAAHQPGLSPAVHEKLLSTNPMRLYGLSG
jgi:predicted TIM-barrel fold metal-dependent hydrolase